MSSPPAAKDSPPAHRVQPRHFQAEPSPVDAPTLADLLLEMENWISSYERNDPDMDRSEYEKRRSAALSMRGGELDCNLTTRAHVLGFSSSQLWRHNTTSLKLGGEAATPESLMLITVTASVLQELEVAIGEATSLPLSFPPQLQELTLTLPMGLPPAAANAAIQVIARLTKLTDLRLTLSDFVDALSFAPLARMPSLRSLWLVCPDGVAFSEAQIEQLRAITGLTTFTLCGWIRRKLDPCRLLAVPHQWQQLQTLGGYCDFTDESGPLLLHLPELTELDLSVIDASCTHVDWLAQVPKLTTLGFVMRSRGSTDIPRVMAALQRCVGLTDLQLHGGKAEANNFFTKEQLDSLLQHLPNLRDLTLSQTPQLRSLSFLSRVASTLTSLTLEECSQRIPVRELKRITSLRQLEDLHIQHDVFDRQLTDLEVDFMQPPSLLMPGLREFEFAADLYTDA